MRSGEAAGSFAIRSERGLLTNRLHIFERPYVVIRNRSDHLDGIFRVDRISLSTGHGIYMGLLTSTVKIVLNVYVHKMNFIATP